MKPGPEQAADYYNASDVMTFYRECWGGEAIHIGRYDRGDESVGDASAAMTDHLISLAGITAGQDVIDIACGVGGTVGKLAALGCNVTGIDISENEISVARDRLGSDIASGRVVLKVRDFHELDSPADRFDAALCQESIIHSHDRAQVFEEVFRVLKPGAVFVYSDILTAVDADLSAVQTAFDRLRAAAGATPDDYQEMAESAGFETLQREERPEDIRIHYEKLEACLGSLRGAVSAEFFESVNRSIAAWRLAVEAGHITWACFLSRKPI